MRYLFSPSFGSGTHILDSNESTRVQAPVRTVNDVRYWKGVIEISECNNYYYKIT